MPTFTPRPVLCSVAFAFISATIGIIVLVLRRRTQRRIFEHTLTPSERVVYDRVRHQRRVQYVVATVAGIVVASIGTLLVHRARGRGEATLVHRGASLVCVFIAAMMTTQMLVYLSWPRSEFLLNELSSPEKRKYWLNAENTFQRWFYVTFAGALFTSLLVNFIR